MLAESCPPSGRRCGGSLTTYLTTPHPQGEATMFMHRQLVGGIFDTKICRNRVLMCYFII